MINLMKCYVEDGINALIRVDHAPTISREKSTLAGYDALDK